MALDTAVLELLGVRLLTRAALEAACVAPRQKASEAAAELAKAVETENAAKFEVAHEALLAEAAEAVDELLSRVLPRLEDAERAMRAHFTLDDAAMRGFASHAKRSRVGSLRFYRASWRTLSARRHVDNRPPPRTKRRSR
jgi:hypothetical protein